MNNLNVDKVVHEVKAKGFSLIDNFIEFDKCSNYCSEIDNIIKKKTYIIASRSEKLKSVNVVTKPYPGFPTDLQAQIMVLMTRADGISTIREGIFENRFMHVSELRRMGAQIVTNGNKAKIFGNTKLNGAEIMATDLRASVCLVLAGLVSSNKTILNRIYHLDRGYEKIESKLSKCGAQIKRLQ